MKNVLFIHGLFSSGQCPQAEALREALLDNAIVLSPDMPLHPEKALFFLRDLCDSWKPDLIVGNSCGSFYAQIIAPVVGIPALLGNPHFRMTEFLQKRKGDHQYKFPRKDGKSDFTIDDTLIDEFAAIEKEQFDCCSAFWSERVWGLFGDNDTLAGFEEEFLQHYRYSFHFPGNHTPTPEEVKLYYAPLALEMMEKFPIRERRYFRHFKGEKYLLVGSALDSETLERKTVYKALYGEGQLWVRPEKMFFGKTLRDGVIIERFSEFLPSGEE